MSDLASLTPRRDANGANIPAIGLGTWQLRGSECVRAVSGAINIGYRHIDTAAMYENEVEVGEGLRACALQRSDIFVTTKVWTTEIAGGALQVSATQSLKRLKLEQVDLLLIHWPNRSIPLAQSMKALCEVKRKGLARNIGVANFPVAMLEDAVRLAADEGEVLATNQCEYHPLLSQAKLLEACRKHNIAFVSYCPVGKAQLFAHPTIATIAKTHNKAPSQIILRWHLQQPDVVAIPKSGSAAHQLENLSIFDFELSQDEMRAIHGLAQRGGRMVDPSFAPDWDR
jgi:diketogulonate reductase-like aldo/keto reductase